MTIHATRVWLLLPVAIVGLLDIALTLIGQSASYWSGNYQEVLEANPFAMPFLVRSPWLFLGSAIGFLALMCGLLLLWKHRIANSFAIFMAVSHTLGGSAWLLRVMGWGAAVVYLVLAAQLMLFCWRRYHSSSAASATSRTCSIDRRIFRS